MSQSCGKSKVFFTLAEIYDAKGEIDLSLQYHAKSLTERLLITGETNADVANSYHGIAMIFDQMGKVDKALEYYEKSLAIRLETLGEDHPDVAQSYN